MGSTPDTHSGGSAIACRACGRSFMPQTQLRDLLRASTDVAEPPDVHEEVTRIAPTSSEEFALPSDITQPLAMPVLTAAPALGPRTRTNPLLPAQAGEATARLREFSPRQKAMGALLVALLVVPAAVWAALRARHPAAAWVAMSQPLLAEPAHGSVPPRSQGAIARGAQVTVFDDLGTYVMVRDLQGRVGYVTRDGLTARRPDVLPDQPFVDCQPTPSEPTAEGCEARGEAQWDCCGGTCDREGSGSRCTEGCRARYKQCPAICHGEPAAPPDAPRMPDAPSVDPHSSRTDPHAAKAPLKKQAVRKK